jgi:hypothetical protein
MTVSKMLLRIQVPHFVFKIIDMKKNLILLMILFHTLNVFSQQNCDIQLNGYSGNAINNYFIKAHEELKNSLSLSDSYNCAVAISVSKGGDISDLRIWEVPSAPLNDAIRSYLKKLFFTSDQKWKIINSNTNSNLVFYLKIIPKTYDKVAKIKTDIKFSEFLISDLLNIINKEMLCSPTDDEFLILKL